jgi:hypothetical protein
MILKNIDLGIPGRWAGRGTGAPRQAPKRGKRSALIPGAAVPKMVGCGHPPGVPISCHAWHRSESGDTPRWVRCSLASLVAWTAGSTEHDRCMVTANLCFRHCQPVLPPQALAVTCSAWASMASTLPVVWWRSWQRGFWLLDCLPDLGAEGAVPDPVALDIHTSNRVVRG